MKNLNNLINELLIEKRRNPEQNKHKDNTIQFISELKANHQDKDTFITMVSIPKLSINPINLYGTPTSVYSYCLGDYSSIIVKTKTLKSLPYQSDLEYTIFFKIKEGQSYRIVEVDDYSGDDLKSDLQKLKSYYESESTRLAGVDLKEIGRIKKEKADYVESLSRDIYDRFASLVSVKGLNQFRKYKPEDAINEWSNLRSEIRDLMYDLKPFQGKEADNVDRSITTVMNHLDSLVEHGDDSYNDMLEQDDFIRAIDFISKNSSNNDIFPYLNKAKELDSKVRTMLKSVNKGFSLKNKSELTDIMNGVKRIITELDSLPDSLKQEKQNEINEYKATYKELNTLFIRMTQKMGKTNATNFKITRNIAHRLSKLSNMWNKNVSDHTKRGWKGNEPFPFQQLMKTALNDTESAYSSSPSDDVKRFRGLWFLIMNIAEELSFRSFNRKPNILTNIFKKVLNIGGIVDHGDSIIHENEPAQAVFFDSSILVPIKLVRNANYRNTENFNMNDMTDKEILDLFANNLSRKRNLKDLKEYLYANKSATKSNIPINYIYESPEVLKRILDVCFSIPIFEKEVAAGRTWLNDLYNRNYKIKYLFRHKYGDWLDKKIQNAKVIKK